MSRRKYLRKPIYKNIISPYYINEGSYGGRSQFSHKISHSGGRYGDYENTTGRTVGGALDKLSHLMVKPLQGRKPKNIQFSI